MGVAQSPAARDDAPATTSKRDHVADQARDDLPEPRGSSLTGRTVTINRPRNELYTYWRNFSNLASFMDNIVRVDLIDEHRSHWVVRRNGG